MDAPGATDVERVSHERSIGWLNAGATRVDLCFGVLRGSGKATKSASLVKNSKEGGRHIVPNARRVKAFLWPWG